MEIFLATSLIFASIKDIKDRNIPDDIWIIALPSAVSHIEISIIPVIVLGSCFILYRLNIFGGADAKAISLISILSTHGLTVFLSSFFFCALSATAYLFYALYKKSKLQMSYPFIPVVAIFYFIFSMQEPLLL